MRFLPLALLLALAPAQAQPEAPAFAPIRAFFDGMRAGDSAVVRQAFHPDARLIRVAETADGTRLQVTPLQQLLDAIGSPHDAVYDERLWDIELQIHGPMATAWTPYAFYLGDTLSHCGVNAFQLAELDGRWQILGVTDTSQREGCEVPAAVQAGARW